MDRAFSTVHHRCFFPHKKLQTVLNYVDLPLSISYYWLKCCSELTFVSRKEKSHFSVGRRIRCTPINLNLTCNSTHAALPPGLPDCTRFLYKSNPTTPMNDPRMRVWTQGGLMYFSPFVFVFTSPNIFHFIFGGLTEALGYFLGCYWNLIWPNEMGYTLFC